MAEGVDVERAVEAPVAIGTMLRRLARTRRLGIVGFLRGSTIRLLLAKRSRGEKVRCVGNIPVSAVSSSFARSEST